MRRYFIAPQMWLTKYSVSEMAAIFRAHGIAYSKIITRDQEHIGWTLWDFTPSTKWIGQAMVGDYNLTEIFTSLSAHADYYENTQTGKGTS